MHTNGNYCMSMLSASASPWPKAWIWHSFAVCCMRLHVGSCTYLHLSAFGHVCTRSSVKVNNTLHVVCFSGCLFLFVLSLVSHTIPLFDICCVSFSWLSLFCLCVASCLLVALVCVLVILPPSVSVFGCVLCVIVCLCVLRSCFIDLFICLVL